MLSLSMEMRPELVEGLAEEFPKLRRLGNERSYEDETAAYRNNTRQMQEQVALRAVALLARPPTIRE
ncbi:uncharacterized protein STEHIDRAFT_156088 [Stereum hirsutum FP-91666 SS1]|uniref:uncharacterized protein n=1 Tax=Stereum hirsutum (strain FP-91666) TaxID=721885 RepID=UPI000440B8D9|nr:uncharacterized protein STEHIDRAFT_156088 [Stereum hirsutum FP-91666 SS1]EIM87098.1 hypothetical protein STEHIDRAFT_156088 [Stereum hirsutum FP-91666 SS1]